MSSCCVSGEGQVKQSLAGTKAVSPQENRDDSSSGRRTLSVYSPPVPCAMPPNAVIRLCDVPAEAMTLPSDNGVAVAYQRWTDISAFNFHGVVSPGVEPFHAGFSV